MFHVASSLKRLTLKTIKIVKNRFYKVTKCFGNDDIVREAYIKNNRY